MTKEFFNNSAMTEKDIFVEGLKKRTKKFGVDVIAFTH